MTDDLNHAVTVGDLLSDLMDHGLRIEDWEAVKARLLVYFSMTEGTTIAYRGEEE